MNGVFKDLAEKGLVPAAVIFSGRYRLFSRYSQNYC